MEMKNAAGGVNLCVRRITMKLRDLSTVQLLAIGLLTSLLSATVAEAAPLYRGKFTLPYAVRWGQAVLPAGEYQLKFRDVQTSVFVVLQDAKSSKDVAYLLPVTNSDTQGTSALLIADEGKQRVVHSLRLAELGKAFIFEPALTRAARDVREAHTMQTLPVVAMKK
jgi:hypothetical protein